jgi:hypothetical protein
MGRRARILFAVPREVDYPPLMKRRWYLLLVLVPALLALPLTVSGQRGGRQGWEYKTITRSRGFERVQDSDSPFSFHRAGDWTQWFEDNVELAAPVDVLKRINVLGAQGWELVSVVPRSSMTGAEGHAFSPDWAGFTSDDLWVFKRARP